MTLKELLVNLKALELVCGDAEVRVRYFKLAGNNRSKQCEESLGMVTLESGEIILYGNSAT